MFSIYLCVVQALLEQHSDQHSTEDGVDSILHCGDPWGCAASAMKNAPGSPSHGMYYIN